MPALAGARAGICHGCGERTDVAKFYCAACRAEQCPECKRFASQHAAACRYTQRLRRPARTTTLFRRVTEAHVIALFEACAARAVRHARWIGGLTPPDAEDVVAEVFEWIWKNRHAFAEPPGPALLFSVVRRAALRVHQYAWARYVVAMDPADLVFAEQAMYDPTAPPVAVPQ